MSGRDSGVTPSQSELERALADLATSAPADFGLRVLQHVRIPEERYDTYVRLDAPAGGVYVAHSSSAITGSALEAVGIDSPAFEELHWRRTRRTAIRTTKAFPGLRPALRAHRTRQLPLDLGDLSTLERTVLEAVRSIPRGQLRPLDWLSREADVEHDTDTCLGALAHNPMPLLVPCHRVTYNDGTPCDAAYGTAVGSALRAAEDIDMRRLGELLKRGAVFLGSATTHIYCHPTCAHARRITPPHQMPFRTAREAHQAGYRACRSCRPVTV